MNEFDLVRLLKQKKLHICCAESITGGLLSGAIINVPDASAVLKEGFVTYCDEAKIKYLGVSPETIGKFGVVSVQTAGEMALGAANASGAEIAVGITGYGGPTGGDEFAEVGDVCFGFYVQGKLAAVKKSWPNTERNEIRRLAAAFAIDELYKQIQGGTQ